MNRQSLITVEIWLFIFVVAGLVLNASGWPITNLVEFSTNINFCLKLKRSLGPDSEFKSDDTIDYLFTGPGTNVIYLREFPCGRFEFHLFDAKEIEVPKTPAGVNLTRIPPMPTRDDLILWRQSRFFPLIIGHGLANERPLLRPEDVFMITNRGVYQLEVRARLCVIMTNGGPDFSAMADGMNSTPSGAHLFKDFGVLTSPPLRVKVIKE